MKAIDDALETLRKNGGAVIIEGWWRDIILQRLEQRGFKTVHVTAGPPGPSEARILEKPGEGIWTVTTERFGKPCTVLTYKN